MLPMDEVYGKNIFSINSDSRVINVPASFKTNGVSVTGDKLAETLLFEIDRFYDITDLASTEIYIQWMNPAGRTGASKITIVDYSTKPGKLVFGWPLTDVISVEGKESLKFSVRFIKRGDNDEIIYTLNTMPASVKINQALFTQWDPEIEIENANEMLDKAISNGPIGDGVEPLVPEYVIDLSGEAMTLDADNKANLQVAAVTGDNGTLKYSWFYIPKYIENNEVVTGNYQAIEGSEIYIPTLDTDFVDKKVYYTVEDGGAATVYDNTLGWKTGLYEKVSEYNINWTDGEHITGEYYVNVTNKIGSRETNKVRSKSVFFNCPESIAFSEGDNLNSDTFMNEDGVTLRVVSVATPGNSNISYKWFKVNGEEAEEIDGIVSSAYTTTEPGWYKVIAYATLNQETMSVESNVCRVLADIQAPTIIAPPENEDSYPTSADENGVFELLVEYELSTDKLISDDVEFTWYRKSVDADNDTIVTLEDADVIEINDNILKVKPLNSISTVDYFYCVITNILAGKKASSKSGIFQVI